MQKTFNLSLRHTLENHFHAFIHTLWWFVVHHFIAVLMKSCEYHSYRLENTCERPFERFQCLIPIKLSWKECEIHCCLNFDFIYWGDSVFMWFEGLYRAYCTLWCESMHSVCIFETFCTHIDIISHLATLLDGFHAIWRRFVEDFVLNERESMSKRWKMPF